MTISIIGCEFKALYNDLKDGERIKLWHCDQERGSSNHFCCFHDKTKLQWDDGTFERFRQMILSHEKTKKLFLIGYYFPDNISFKTLLPPNDPLEKAEPPDRDIRQRLYEFPIYLCDAEFSGQVEFSHCRFEKELNLSGTIFRREVLFRDSIFKGMFYPRSTKFYGKVDFRMTEFNDADFHDTVFKDKANFRYSTFSSKTKSDKRRFLDVKFQDRVNFVGTKFYSETKFVGTTFNKAFFSPDVKFQSRTKFKYVVFEDGEKILFATEDLSRVSFENTDITRVRFSDRALWGEERKILDERDLSDSLDRRKSLEHIFTWKRIPNDKNHNDRLKNFLKELSGTGLAEIDDINFNKENEETIKITHKERPGINLCIRLNREKAKAFLIKQENEKKNLIYEFHVKGKFNVQVYPNSKVSPEVDLESIIAIYRNLRENYEYRLRYDEAGEFFIREMELKRMYRQDQHGEIKEVHWLRRNVSLTGFYRLASYGEKLRMPAIFGLTVLFISMLYWLLQFPFIEDVSLSTESTNPLLNVTERSLTVFLQLKNENLIWPDYIIKALGIFSLGLFAIPLRRRFERKFRH